MYANTYVYTIDERARFSSPIWHIADEQDYRPIGTYKPHRLLKRKMKMGINKYWCNRIASKFNMRGRRT